MHSLYLSLACSSKLVNVSESVCNYMYHLNYGASLKVQADKLSQFD